MRVETTTTRPVGRAQIRFFQGAARLGSVDLYLLEEGADVAQSKPVSADLKFQGRIDFIAVATGFREMLLTLPNSHTVVAGPIPVELEGGSVYEVFAIDGCGITTADLVVVKVKESL